MTTPEPKTVREIARKHIRSGRTDIGTTVALHFGRGVLSYEEFAAWEYDVHKAWRVELRAVEWPDEQQPADVVTAEQQQDGAALRDIADLLSDENLDAHRTSASIVAAVRELREQLAAATARAEKAEARLAELGDEWGVQSEDSERAQPCDDEDHARRLADRYSRFRLPGGERTLYRVVRRLATEWCDTETVDAPPDGRSEPVERSETSGGIGTASNSSTGTAGLSAACGNKYSYHVCFLPAGHDGDHRDDRYWRWPTHLGTWTSDDATEDGQHG